MSTSSIKPSSIDALIEELKNATGLKFDHYQRKFLEKRIDFRMKNLNLNYYNDYINYIRENPVEVDLFLDKFTINYTYFFRNYSVYENFEKFIDLYTKYNKKKMRIWSAPCATGDEPYSIAIVLNEIKKKKNNGFDFEIIASDIDPTAIRTAKKGIYGEYSVHETPKEYLQNYFSKENTQIGPKFILEKEIKNKVEFIQEDIIKGHQKNIKYDIIFCRNFFIYINQYAREKLLRIIESRLYDGGLLILGGSETLPIKNSCFETINMKNRFYIKNLISQDLLYKKSIYNQFKPFGNSKKESQSFASKRENEVNNPEVKAIQKIEPSVQKAQKEIKKEGIPIEEIEKKQTHIENVIDEIEILETEVRITGIEVNNGFKKDSFSNLYKHPKDIISNDINHSQIILKNKIEKDIKQREINLEKREKLIEERIAYLDKKYKKIEKKRKEVNELIKEVKIQEEEFKNRILILERLTKHVEQRERLIEQKERQFERKIRQVGNYTRQVVQREAQMNGMSNELKKKKEDLNNYEEKRLDRIENPNNNKELKIPMGYYGLINSFDRNEQATKFVVQGLGSGIALILKDPVNNIFGMSHISLPSSTASKQGYHLLFPHTFADTSVKDLYNNLLYNGAKKANITALIVGGAKLFLDYDMTYQENIDAVKEHLLANNIILEAEDTGGLSERAVIYDTITDSLYVKKTWEFDYRKIS
ncbi:MAG: CheR family methyltransferase [Promethearchaeota archaeon]